MISQTIYKYLGDKRAANALRHAGFHQLGILKNAMSFQGLQQNRRVVEFSDGTWIICTSVFGIDVVNIYVPPLLPVGGERKVVKEEFCFCSTYFTEGRIVEIVESILDEGSYPPFYNKYKYYDEIFNNKITSEADYTGIRYKVKVCRGIKEVIVICSSSDLTKYEVGDAVILFCSGEYTNPTNRTYFSGAFSQPFPCPGRQNACFSCSAIMKTVETETEIEGTYVIVPLSFSRDTNATGNTIKLVSPAALEQGEVYLGRLEITNTSEQYEKINYINNTVILELSNGITVTAEILCNTKAPLAYTDRVRMALFALAYGHSNYPVVPTKPTDYRTADLLVLYINEEYLVIGYSYNTPIRYPNRTIRLALTVSNSIYDTYCHQCIWNMDTDQQLELIEGDTWNKIDTKYKRIELLIYYSVIAEPCNLSTEIIYTGEAAALAHTVHTKENTIIEDITIAAACRGFTCILNPSYEYTTYAKAKSVGTTSGLESSNTYDYHYDCTIKPIKFCGVSAFYTSPTYTFSREFYNPYPIYYTDSDMDFDRYGKTTHTMSGMYLVRTDYHMNYTFSGKMSYYNRDKEKIFDYTKKITLDWNITHNYTGGRISSSPSNFSNSLEYTNQPIYTATIPLYTLGKKTLGVLQVILCMDWSASNDEAITVSTIRPDEGEMISKKLNLLLHPDVAEDNLTAFITFYYADNIPDITTFQFTDCIILGDTGTTSNFIAKVKNDIVDFYFYSQNNYPGKTIQYTIVDGFSIDNN